MAKNLFQKLVARIGQRDQQAGKDRHAFIRAVADEKLTDLAEIEAGLERLNMAPVSLEREVLALKQRRTLQGSIRRQPELQAKLADLESQHAKGEQAFNAVAKKWRADSERLREEQATIRLQLAAVHHHRSQLLSSTPTYAREELKPLDAALVELNHRRQHLAEMLSTNTSNVYDRRFTPVRITASLLAQKRECESTIGRVEAIKLVHRSASDKRGLQDAKVRLEQLANERAAAEKELATIEREISIIQKKQAELRESLVLI